MLQFSFPILLAVVAAFVAGFFVGAAVQRARQPWPSLPPLRGGGGADQPDRPRHPNDLPPAA